MDSVIRETISGTFIYAMQPVTGTFHTIGSVYCRQGIPALSLSLSLSLSFSNFPLNPLGNDLFNGNGDFFFNHIAGIQAQCLYIVDA